MGLRLSALLSGRFGRGFRFVLSGGGVALLYLTLTTALAEVAGVHFQLALAVGYATALAAHFSLQRFFVWAQDEEYVLSLHAQVARYVALAAAQYGSTVIVTLTAPPALHVRPTVVYVAWTLVVSAVGFVLFGRGVFHSTRDDDPDDGY